MKKEFPKKNLKEILDFINSEIKKFLLLNVNNHKMKIISERFDMFSENIIIIYISRDWEK